MKNLRYESSKVPKVLYTCTTFFTYLTLRSVTLIIIITIIIPKLYRRVLCDWTTTILIFIYLPTYLPTYLPYYLLHNPVIPTQPPPPRIIISFISTPFY